MDAALERLDQVLNAPPIRRAPSKRYLALKAAAIAGVDQGTFTAVISTERPDREKDIVPATSMVRALRSWDGTGKRVPLAWNHSGRAEDIIGHVDPASVKAENGEVIASGWADQSTPQGREAWRLIKSGTIGFSSGYLTLKSEPRDGGGRHIHDLDVFEVSCTSTPMNHDTRVVSWKAQRQPPSNAELLQRIERLEYADLVDEHASVMMAALEHKATVDVEDNEDWLSTIEWAEDPSRLARWQLLTESSRKATADDQDRRARQYLVEYGIPYPWTNHGEKPC
jgi:HK97 family phage prohead protease